jgi:hypothetical protein
MVAGARSAAPQAGRAARVVRLLAGRGGRAACVPPPSAGATVGGAALVARVKGPPCVQDAWARGSGAPARAPPLLEPYGRLAPCAVSALSCPVSALPSCGGEPSGRAGGVGRARLGPEVELSDARAPRCRAGAVRRGRLGPELELSNVRAPVPNWSCPTWAPRARAGAVQRGRPGAELELSDVGATGSSCQNLLADSRGVPALNSIAPLR